MLLQRYFARHWDQQTSYLYSCNESQGQIVVAPTRGDQSDSQARHKAEHGSSDKRSEVMSACLAVAINLIEGSASPALCVDWRFTIEGPPTQGLFLGQIPELIRQDSGE